MERENRLPDELEHRRVTETVKETIKDRRFGTMVVNGLLFIPIFMISLFIGASKVKGEPQIESAVFFFFIFVGIMIVIDVLVDLYGKSWKNVINRKKYGVIDAVVVDKEHFSGRHSYFHVDVKYEDGETETFSVTEPVYEQAGLGTKVIIVVAEDEKAMISRRDLVINEDPPAEPQEQEMPQQDREYDSDDDEDEGWD